ncbi:acyl-homoserine-lactone synthase [Lentibacter sp.]|uniref:acyl-homoserine-lactone synthase n=1 Tax=Lentibacter sp. TaxID=2024994 RepID=UPI003F6A22B4
MWNRIVVSDQNRGVYGALVHEHLRKRRVLFHDKLGWDIPRSAHIEQDQYDRAETVYILIERDGQVEGYARLLPTSARVSYGVHEYSYMMRDATLGLLPGIPATILGSRVAPTERDIWEVSRLEASGKPALTALFLTIAEFLEEVGAVELLAFTRKNFDAIVRGIGFEAAVVGSPVDYGGKPYCAISMTWGEGDKAEAPDSAEAQAEPFRLAG